MAVILLRHSQLRGGISPGDLGVRECPELHSKSFFPGQSLSQVTRMNQNCSVSGDPPNERTAQLQMRTKCFWVFRNVRTSIHRFPRFRVQSQGWQTLSVEGQTVIIQALCCRLSLVIRTQLCHYRAKVATDNPHMSARGCVPIKLY